MCCWCCRRGCSAMKDQTCLTHSGITIKYDVEVISLS
jgi:hypothetical protein